MITDVRNIIAFRSSLVILIALCATCGRADFFGERKGECVFTKFISALMGPHASHWLFLFPSISFTATATEGFREPFVRPCSSGCLTPTTPRRCNIRPREDSSFRESGSYLAEEQEKRDTRATRANIQQLFRYGGVTIRLT